MAQGAGQDGVANGLALRTKRVLLVPRLLSRKASCDGLTVQPVGQSVGMKGGMENKQLNPKKKPV